jgi:hypothetical protein
MLIIGSFLLLAVVVIGIGGLCYVYKIGPFRPLLSRERYFAIREVIRTTPSAVIVFGDSIVEAALLPSSICGTPIVNAGVGGAGIGYFLRYSKELLGASAPKLIVLAVGINDAHEETLRSFRSRHQSAVTALSQRAPLVLATIATLHDAATYITELPDKISRQPHWQIAVRELMMAAERGGILMLAEIAMKRAINHDTGLERPERRKRAKADKIIR